MLKWDENWNLSVNFINEDHRHAVDLINRGLAAEDIATAILTLRALLVFFREHFERENQMMRAARFPDIDRHLDEHARVINEMESVLHEMGEGVNRKPYFKELATWLITHLNSQDRKAADFVMSSELAHPNH